jgi:hypothetical protein
VSGVFFGFISQVVYTVNVGQHIRQSGSTPDNMLNEEALIPGTENLRIDLLRRGNERS